MKKERQSCVFSPFFPSSINLRGFPQKAIHKMNKQIATRFFKAIKPMDFPGYSSNEIRIKFKGRNYLLIGDLEKGGPIATQKQYENFECSYAHLFPDGLIKRFNKVIGTRADIKIIEERK